MNSPVGKNCYLMSRQDSITIRACWVESPGHGPAGGAATIDTPDGLTCAASAPLCRVQRARRYPASVAYYLFFLAILITLTQKETKEASSAHVPIPDERARDASFHTQPASSPELRASVPSSFSGRRPKMRYAKSLRLTSEQLVSTTKLSGAHNRLGTVASFQSASRGKYNHFFTVVIRCSGMRCTYLHVGAYRQRDGI